jgi:hypothetical protein
MPKHPAHSEAPGSPIPPTARALVRAILAASESGLVLANIPATDAPRFANALVRGLMQSPRNAGDRARLLLELARFDPEAGQ